MILNDRFQMLREARKIVILSAAVLVAVVGGLLASVELTYALSPIVAVAAEAGSNAENKQEDKKEEAKDPKQGNADDSAKPTKSVEHSGVVIDGETDKPIAGVTVTVTRMN